MTLTDSTSANAAADHAGPADGGLTRRLAEHVAAITLEALPEAVAAAARAVFTDTMACAVAGSKVSGELVQPVARLARHMASGGPCTSVPTGTSLDPLTASLLNGVAAHSIDYDDTHMAVVTHFGASVVPAALAAVEVSGGGEPDLLAGIVAGFEAGARVGRACMPQHYQRWHATGSLGGIAAAAAAARAMRLTPEQTEMVIGLAADDTGGTRVAIAQGDISKSLHAGLAAQKGIRSAMLVASGARGPVGHLEHPYGFFWAYSDERDARRLPEQLADMGTRWEILEDDIKAYPCILSSHTAVEATLQLRSAHALSPDDIARVDLVQPRYSENHGMNRRPTTAMAARLSVPYCVSIALIDGQLGMAQFTGDRWNDPKVIDLMDRVHLSTDEELRARYPGQAPNRVTLTTVGGETFEQEIGIALGSHQRPMSAEQLASKHAQLIALTDNAPAQDEWRRLTDAMGEDGTSTEWLAQFRAFLARAASHG